MINVKIVGGIGENTVNENIVTDELLVIAKEGQSGRYKIISAIVDPMRVLFTMMDEMQKIKDVFIDAIRSGMIPPPPPLSNQPNTPKPPKRPESLIQTNGFSAGGPIEGSGDAPLKFEAENEQSKD